MKTTRTETMILRDITEAYFGLEPEVLYCDGERSRSEAQRVAARLRRQLRECFKELGREVSESEAWNLKLGRESLEERRTRIQSRPWSTTTSRPSEDTSSTTATGLGLPDDIVGKSFKVRRTTYTVTGFNTRNFKYPVLATTQNGKRYKLDVDFVLTGLGLKAPKTAVTPDAPTSAFNGSLEDLVGRTFKFRNRTYTVHTIKRSNHKYPVLATRNPDGKRFKFPADIVTAGLIKAA